MNTILSFNCWFANGGVKHSLTVLDSDHLNILLYIIYHLTVGLSQILKKVGHILMGGYKNHIVFHALEVLSNTEFIA